MKTKIAFLLLAAVTLSAPAGTRDLYVNIVNNSSDTLTSFVDWVSYNGVSLAGPYGGSGYSIPPGSSTLLLPGSAIYPSDGYSYWGVKFQVTFSDGGTFTSPLESVVGGISAYTYPSPEFLDVTFTDTNYPAATTVTNTIYGPSTNFYLLDTNDIAAGAYAAIENAISDPGCLTSFTDGLVLGCTIAAALWGFTIIRVIVDGGGSNEEM
jgi:hypothetical protein